MQPHTPEQFPAAYAAAVLDQNAAAFLALYTPDARVFDTWGVWVYEGTAARQASIEAWLGSLGDERVQVRFENVHTTTTATLAVLTATCRYAAIGPDGRELRAMHNRLTWALTCEAGQWHIAHEHTSAPIGFGDLRAILSRDAA